MEYQQARRFIKETEKSGIIYGLDSIQSLMAHLGNVQEQVPYVHTAGTNGKGSVCAMLAQILASSGYRTGVYASPAVFDEREILKVNGIPVSKERYAQLIAKVQKACAEMEQEGLRHPTAFEAETAAAFCYFQEENCDIVLLETGMGGSLDATNLITHPLLSILTSISIDHRAFLGNTLKEITEAKAGIIKPGCPCVTAPQKPEVLEVIRKAAAEKGSELWEADSAFIARFAYDGQGSEFETAGYGNMESGREAAGLECAESGMKVPELECAKSGFESDGPKSGETGYTTVQEYTEFAFESGKSGMASDLYSLHGKLALAGACQKENLVCVLTAVSVLKRKGFRIPPEAVLKGLSDVRLPGRFERIAARPDFYIDGAHNEGAALRLQETVQQCLKGRRTVFIIGVLADKEYKKVLEIMLPLAAEVFTVTPENPRALDGRELARQAAEYCARAVYVPEISQAVHLAKAAAGEDGAVLVFGSFSYLRELKQAVRKE